jgi:hypothetical protein
VKEQIQNLSDAELEQAVGGVSINLTLDKAGISLSSPLGELKLPNPLKAVGEIAGAVFGTAGDLLGKVGGALTSIGQIFDFS